VKESNNHIVNIGGGRQLRARFRKAEWKKILQTEAIEERASGGEAGKYFLKGLAKHPHEHAWV